LTVISDAAMKHIPDEGNPFGIIPNLFDEQFDTKEAF
jgi:hypothetical protein